MIRIFISSVCLTLMFVGAFAGLEHANSSLLQKNNLCHVCVDLTERVQKDITIDAIDKFLNEVCSLTGDGVLNEECSKLASALKSKIYIHFDAQKECDKLMMCNKWSNVVEKIVQGTEDGVKEAEKLIDEIFSNAVDKIVKLDPKKLETKVRCSLCKTIVTGADILSEPIKVTAGVQGLNIKMNCNAGMWVNNITMRILILNITDSICDDLPDPTYKICLESLNQFIDKVWAEIFKSPEKVCTFFKMCSSDSSRRKALGNV